MIKSKELLISILEKMKVISNNMSLYNEYTANYLNGVVTNWKNLNENNQLSYDRVLNFRNSFNRGLNWIDMNKKDREIWNEIYEMMTKIIDNEKQK